MIADRKRRVEKAGKGKGKTMKIDWKDRSRAGITLVPEAPVATPHG